MVSLKLLKERGITDEKLKKLFSSVQYPFSEATKGTVSDGLGRLVRRIRARVQDGIQNNFKTYKLYHAIDQAWNVPFKQISPTLIQALASQKFDESVLSAAQEWGLSHLITEDLDDKTGKPTGKKRMSLPTFFNIFVPLVRAYVIIRAAKLTGDRNLFPFFKFDPTKSDAINRARCEIITSRIEAMVTQIGYRDVGRQAILNMLIYGTQLMFIQEEWWKDEQEDEEGTKTIQREGLRYHLPHPSRTYWDIAHPLSTLNSNTGCQFAGYWRVHRFRDVKDMGLWNTDKIAFNGEDYRTNHAAFFNSVYAGCVLQFPQTCLKWADLDRERNLQDTFYTSDFDDSAVIVVEHFEQVNPKRDGLGDYDHPVWFRFVTAGDGTILYASPLPDVGAIAWEYDPQGSQYAQPSLALEVLPFQDQVSNLLTQALLSVRQNLSNLTFVDQDIVDEPTLKAIENTGEGLFRKLNFLRFSGRKTRAAQQDVRYAFGSVRFPQLDVPSIFSAINAVLAVLERVLVMSAQEIAGQATHEQSKQEILHVQASTSTRLGYTGMQVDRSWDGWKRQLYGFLMTFGAPEIYGQLSQDPAYTPELLEMLGFTFESKAKTYDEKHGVRGPKSALQLEYFASTRDGNERVNDTAMAQAMLQMLTAALQNPILAQRIGAEQSIMLVNQVLEQMGLPRDFKLRPVPPEVAPEEQQQMLQQQFGELTKQVQQFVQQNQKEVLKLVGDELKPLAAEVKQAVKRNLDQDQSLAQIVKMLTTPPPSPAQPKLTIGERA